jgi:hypothetical protein
MFHFEIMISVLHLLRSLEFRDKRHVPLQDTFLWSIMREKTGVRHLKNQRVEVEWVEQYSIHGRRDRMKVLNTPQKKVKMTPSKPTIPHRDETLYEQEFDGEPIEPLKLPKVGVEHITMAEILIRT